jgi:hypothetical protein
MQRHNDDHDDHDRLQGLDSQADRKLQAASDVTSSLCGTELGNVIGIENLGQLRTMQLFNVLGFIERRGFGILIQCLVHVAIVSTKSRLKNVVCIEFMLARSASSKQHVCHKPDTSYLEY